MSTKKKEKDKKKADHEKVLKEKEEKINELEERVKYLQAEFDNYRKQLDKEKKAHSERASEGIILDLLEIVDDLEQAVKNSEGPEKEGLKIFYDKIIRLLEKKGLEPIEAKGKPFDQYYHEAVLGEESDQEEGTVLEELQKGYMLNSVVIRHSKVKVSRKPAEK